MDELERLRKLVGPEASGWTTAQLEQVRRDIDAMAVLLLDLHRARTAGRNAKACGSPKVDDQQSDR
jgi:predicted nucleic acid-binding protein